MGHFDIGRWADFVRGALSENERAAMQQHLKAGCDGCGDAVETLSRVSKLASADRESAPPDGLVRGARSLATLDRSDGSFLDPTHLRLKIDSGLNPLAAGVRSQADGARDLLFSSASYTVEVRIERFGQILEGSCTGRAGEAAAGVPVCLRSPDRVQDWGTTGTQGGFRLLSPRRCPAELWFFVEGERPLLVSWE